MNSSSPRSYPRPPLRQRSDMLRREGALRLVKGLRAIPEAVSKGRSVTPNNIEGDNVMRMLVRAALVAALCSAALAPAKAEDLLVTQYKADPSGASYASALAKGFFKKAGIDITGIISGAGGGNSVRSAMATDLGFGDV